MTLLVSLVGEQPIPNLLPIKHLNPGRVLLVCTSDTEPVSARLQRIVAGAQPVKVPPYDLGATLVRLQRAVSDATDVTFNLTGGTKPMALAAFWLAAQHGASCVYLQSQGRATVLFRYGFRNGEPALEGQEPLPALITAGEYLRAHLPGYREDGPHRDGRGQIDEAGRFEAALADVLAGRGFEVLCGVRPEGVANQIEIDLVIRAGNQVGIAEVKLSDAGHQGPKAGLDQLALAGGREYLGTYTQKFLITGRQLPPPIHTVARERGITLVELPGYGNAGGLSRREAEYLVQCVGKRLGTEGQPA